jgi:hypothetical protein
VIAVEPGGLPLADNPGTTREAGTAAFPRRQRIRAA